MKRTLILLVAIFAANLAGVVVGSSAFADHVGAYDSQHQWHDAQWWFRHDPNWVGMHHPEWAQTYPQWRANGDWDNHHQWHDRQWWVAHDHAWVKEHHPGWL